MHTDERRDNGPQPMITGAIPVPMEAKKSKLPIILVFAAGFLAAVLIFGIFAAAGRIRHSAQGVTITEGIQIVHQMDSAVLTPIRSSDVNNLQFAIEDVRAMEVTTTSGRINVAFHGEDFISTHCSSGASHSLDDGLLNLSSVSGNFTILLPEDALDALSLRSVSGRVEVDGISRANTVFAHNLSIRTTSGRINLNNLAVPGNLEATSVSGRINISNILSDAQNTNLSSTSGRIVADYP